MREALHRYAAALHRYIGWKKYIYIFMRSHVDIYIL